MRLSAPEKQVELESLIAELNDSNQAFYAVQDNALAIKSNIKRNQKMIEAIESDNQEAQKEIDSLQVSETGEINFDGFDELSERISKNNRKIETIKKVVERFKIQLEIILMTDYQSLYTKSCTQATKCFELAGEALFDEFILNIGIEKLNMIFTALTKSGKYQANYTISSDVRDIFISELVSRLKPQLTNNADTEALGTQSPDNKLSIPKPKGSLALQQNYLADLKNQLNQY